MLVIYGMRIDIIKEFFDASCTARQDYFIQKEV